MNSLLANSIDESDVKIIFEPDGQRFISGVSIGKHQLMVSMLENVNGIITRFLKKDKLGSAPKGLWEGGPKNSDSDPLQS